MRFITSISDDNGYCRKSVFRENPWLLCQMSDGTSVGIEELYGVDALGFCKIPETEVTAVVSYDKKSQRLYDYINGLYTVNGTDSLDCTNAAMIYNGGGAIVDGCKNLVINTGTDTFRLCGKLGSVALVMSGYSTGRYHVYNLYDLLISICKEYRINVLQYERIQLYNKHQPYLTCIILSQTKEAKVFFTKMYMDVAKR